jgi:hypothetical protein
MTYGLRVSGLRALNVAERHLNVVTRAVARYLANKDFVICKDDLPIAEIDGKIKNFWSGS